MNIYKVNDDPNNDAIIGFVIWYPFHFFVYKNVYKHIIQDSEFIIDIGSFISNSQPPELLSDIVELLVKNKVKFRILSYEVYSSQELIENFFIKYKVLISVWMTGCLKLKETNNIKKVNLTYGVGKELATFDLQKRNFDVILTYGNFNNNIYSLITKSVIIGNPKFDDWFGNNFDKDLLGSLNLSSQKKTILYLPTHSDLSSVKLLFSEIKNLSLDYNIIIKVHYLSVREDIELFEQLKQSGVIILKDDSDLITLFKVCDIVLSDNSTAIFEAILADKPLVVTDFHKEDFFDTSHKEVRLTNRGYVGPLTYSYSIEQKIKKDGTVSVIKKPVDLEKIVKESFFISSDMQTKRDHLKKEIFSFFDSNSGKRGAEFINKMTNNESNFRKPLLYHLINDYESRLALNSKHDNYISKITSKITLIVFDVEDYPYEDKILSVHSILHSIAFSKLKVEVFLITKNNQEISLILNKINVGHQAIFFKNIDYQKSLGVLFQEVIMESGGNVIFFTKTSNIVPRNWLLKFCDLYDKNNDVVAVGGYCEKHKKTNIFEEYEYFLFGKKLGLDVKKIGYMKTLYEFKNAIPHQNPFGNIGNSSYKKSVFLEDKFYWPGIYDLKSLEFFLRLNVFKKGPALFSPLQVLDLEKEKFYGFRKKFVKHGSSSYFASIYYPNLQLYSTKFFIEEVCFNLVNGYWKFRMTLVIMFALFFYLVGYSLSFVKFILYKIQIKYKK